MGLFMKKEKKFALGWVSSRSPSYQELCRMQNVRHLLKGARRVSACVVERRKKLIKTEKGPAILDFI
jgi:hypothetical protein